MRGGQHYGSLEKIILYNIVPKDEDTVDVVFAGKKYIYRYNENIFNLAHGVTDDDNVPIQFHLNNGQIIVPLPETSIFNQKKYNKLTEFLDAYS